MDISKKKEVNLTQTAYQTIKEKIVHGELLPGEVISISAMAKELNISRTPVTNACQKLEHDKFLTIAPKQGVIIKTLTIDDAREIYELRAAIETYSAKNSFDFFSQLDIEYLKNSYDKQKLAVQNGDAKAFMSEDTNFHRYLLSKYENTQFFSVLDILFDRAFLIGLNSCKNSFRLLESLKEHENIINCLQQKDKQGFIDAIEKNILDGYKNITISRHNT
ncbi:GntR family transcriptional regulator [Megasphaera paucivorans]|uniref:DNA-binding transcriptional regulator, GntR family n=1 Tax=Megasphaera paucivorans TaxID=349095 RepID=A0A1H0ALS1_9FIRM|nr:GntR family transcriptional regulator [Megasphaera paucivorans]SDN34417.1 DNA-binding transcriptional regulator, GntR family [Megasphaera paucivorans]